MPKRILVSALSDETRVAIVDGNLLTHLQIENNLRERKKGNIYKARVYKVEPSFQAAFVDYGADKHGFLPVSEVHPKYSKSKSDDENQGIQDMLREGQELVVQVVREEIGHKGATLSTFISLPGRYLVLMPESSKTGISRRLDETERARLRELIDSTKLPDGYGVIVRTAGSDQTRRELNRDLQTLLRLAKSIDDRAKRKAPLLLHRDQSLAIRFIRDYLTSDIDAIVIDKPALCEEVEEFIGSIMPRKRNIVKLYNKEIPIFSNYQLEHQIETAFSRQVQLPSGGSIVIDHTEALVAIDVNSGRVKERDIEETAMLTNLEAAREAARQVMLRDLGGLVVIDFIDLREKGNIRKLETEVKNAFKNDKARTKFAKVSEFGLMEISRQRLGATLNSGNFQTCPQCSGQGRVWAPTSRALNVLRKLKELVARNRAQALRVQLPLEVANVLLNKHRSQLVALEDDNGATIEIFGTVGSVDPEQEIEIVTYRQGDGTDASREPRRNEPASRGRGQGDGEANGSRSREKSRDRSAQGAKSKPSRPPERKRDAQPEVEGDDVADESALESTDGERADENGEPRSGRSRRRRGRRGGRGRRTKSPNQSGTDAESADEAPVERAAATPDASSRPVAAPTLVAHPIQSPPSLLAAPVHLATDLGGEADDGFFKRLFRRTRKRDGEE